ncbi:MAG: DUF4345 domain-containing protein [Bacteroidota bacterium]
MKQSKVLTTYLTVAGLLLSFIGGATLLMPVELKAGSGIDIAGNIGVLNDVRASSALVLALAVFTFLGGLRPRLRVSASLIAPLMFLSLGTGRVISILADGMPVEGQIGATVLEFLFGITGVILFNMYREKN